MHRYQGHWLLWKCLSPRGECFTWKCFLRNGVFGAMCFTWNIGFKMVLQKGLSMRDVSVSLCPSCKFNIVSWESIADEMCFAWKWFLRNGVFQSVLGKHVWKIVSTCDRLESVQTVLLDFNHWSLYWSASISFVCHHSFLCLYFLSACGINMASFRGILTPVG